MSDKFTNVPVEEDTTILFELEAEHGDYDVLYQKWHWEGITAESIIFVTADIANLTDAEIEAQVRESPLVREDSPMTLKHSESGYTFANFNFETE